MSDHSGGSHLVALCSILLHEAAKISSQSVDGLYILHTCMYMNHYGNCVSLLWCRSVLWTTSPHASTKSMNSMIFSSWSLLSWSIKCAMLTRARGPGSFDVFITFSTPPLLLSAMRRQELSLPSPPVQLPSK